MIFLNQPFMFMSVLRGLKKFVIFVTKEKIRADLSFDTFKEVHEGTFTEEMDYLKMQAVIFHMI